MAQLAYATLPEQRSGLVTALGIVSIIIGALSVLLSLWNMVSMIAFTSIAAFPPPPPVAPATRPTLVQPEATATQPSTQPAPAAATIATTPALAAAPINPFAGVSTGWVTTSVVLSLISLVLAGMIIAAGIGAVRFRAWSLKLHVWWAVLKIPVAAGVSVAGAFVSVAMFRSMQASMAAQGNPMIFGTGMNWVAIAGAVFNFLVAIAYPVAVLITTRFSAVREPLLGQQTRD